jgi:hypothetical protein
VVLVLDDDVVVLEGALKVFLTADFTLLQKPASTTVGVENAVMVANDSITKNTAVRLTNLF